MTKKNTSTTNFKITTDLITGDILGKPIVDSGYRPMIFPEHVPNMLNWYKGFRYCNVEKQRNVNVDGSISLSKDKIYYIAALPYSFVTFEYNAEKECWYPHGQWIGNAGTTTIIAQYNEVMRFTQPLTDKEAEKIICHNSEKVVKEISNLFNSLSIKEKEEVSLKLFKLIKEYI